MNKLLKKLKGESHPFQNPKSLASFMQRNASNEAALCDMLMKVSRNKIPADHVLGSAFWNSLKGYGPYHLVLGMVEFSHGNLIYAKDHFERSVGLAPSPLAWHCLAKCYSALGSEPLAFEKYKEALSRFPGDKLLTVECATSAFRLGNAKLANEIIAKVREAFAGDVIANTALAKELETALNQKSFERTHGGDLYDDAFVTALWWDYNYCFRRFNRYQEGSGFMRYLIEKHVGDVLRQVDGTNKAVIDFGVMCGAPNYSLARQFPQHRHYAVDRQLLIKTLNDDFYKTSNLEFVDGSIIDFLEQNKSQINGGILFHARTTVVCYPDFVQFLYRRCAELGIEHIVLIENAGFSKTTLLFHDFHDKTAISRPLRSNMFIHSHARMLEDAGYKICDEVRHSKPNPVLGMGLGESAVFMHAKRN